MTDKVHKDGKVLLNFPFGGDVGGVLSVLLKIILV